MIEEYLTHASLREKGKFLWHASVWAILWGLWGELTIESLEGRSLNWSRVRFHFLSELWLQSCFVIIHLVLSGLIGDLSCRLFRFFFFFLWAFFFECVCII